MVVMAISSPEALFQPSTRHILPDKAAAGNPMIAGRVARKEAPEGPF
jgi:hypothetical protein